MLSYYNYRDQPSHCVTPVRRSTRMSVGVARHYERNSPSDFSDSVVVIPNKALSLLLDQ